MSMKVFTRDYRISTDLPEAFNRYFGGMKPCVLDIETSGLSRENSKVILIALLSPAGSGIKITQFLAENHYEEHKVLENTLQFISAENIEYLITYNGAAFDLPFINGRLENSFSEERIDLYNFDLYRFIRLNTNLKSRIGSLRQMAVEDYYGIFHDRQDTITGRESVSMFDEYSLTGNSTLEKIILTHNREDILHLYRLMHLALADIANMDAAMAAYGFPILDGHLAIRPSICKSGRSSASGFELKISGDQLKKPISCAYFPDIDRPYSAVFNSETRMLEVRMPVSEMPGGSDSDDERFYIDTESTGIEMSSDPDCVNGYLILNPRTINLFSALLIDKIINSEN